MGKIQLRELSDGCVNAAKLHDALRYGGYCYHLFSGTGVEYLDRAGDSPPSGLNGATVNAVWVGPSSPLRATWWSVGDTDDTRPRYVSGSGLDVSMGATYDTGIHITFGGNEDVNPFIYTVKSSAASFLKMKLQIPLYAGISSCGIGWRNLGPTSGGTKFDETDYPDVAGIVVAVSGHVYTAAFGNGSGWSTLSAADTGKIWDDTIPHTFEVRVVGDRSVFYYDGEEVSQRTDFQFRTSGLRLVPFFWGTQGSDDATPIYLIDFECGPIEAASSTGGVQK